MVENLQLRMQKSLHHVEVNLSEAKGYEKHVIVELFKETYGKVINSSLPCSPENCQGTHSNAKAGTVVLYGPIK